MMQKLEFEEVEKHFAGKPCGWLLPTIIGLLCVVVMAYPEPYWWNRVFDGLVVFLNGLVAGKNLCKSIEKENTK